MKRADVDALLRRHPPPRLRAPEGFSRRVMEAVYRESLRGGPAALDPAERSRAFRRVGLSFVFSALVLALMLVAPAGILPRGPAAPLTAALEGPASAGVADFLRGADTLVRDALRPQGGSAR